MLSDVMTESSLPAKRPTRRTNHGERTAEPLHICAAMQRSTPLDWWGAAITNWRMSWLTSAMLLTLAQSQKSMITEQRSRERSTTQSVMSLFCDTAPLNKRR
jgi:hypothetical protein